MTANERASSTQKAFEPCLPGVTYEIRVSYNGESDSWNTQRPLELVAAVTSDPHR